MSRLWIINVSNQCIQVLFSFRIGHLSRTYLAGPVDKQHKMSTRCVDASIAKAILKHMFVCPFATDSNIWRRPKFFFGPKIDNLFNFRKIHFYQFQESFQIYSSVVLLQLNILVFTKLYLQLLNLDLYRYFYFTLSPLIATNIFFSRLLSNFPSVRLFSHSSMSVALSVSSCLLLTNCKTLPAHLQ